MPYSVIDVNAKRGTVKIRLSEYIRTERDRDIAKIGESIDGVVVSELFGAQNNIVIIAGPKLNEENGDAERVTTILKKLANSFFNALADMVNQDEDYWLMTELEIETKKASRARAHEALIEVHSTGSLDNY